ncbi:MAG: flagellar biosynthetic protein FliR [Leptospiraceae bacterium]|mgnify:CR=1 FL=1|nr:flagellar biosynthetic protein FliR [Leptospiraceae bacterium]MCB1303752.1 flagellar biosynthetic protein FliR [Leptospiraceae bacterium]
MEAFSTGLLYYVLIVARVAGLIFTAPVFNSQAIGYRAQMVISLALSFVLYPVVANHLNAPPQSMGPFILELLCQVFLGTIMGFMIQLVFAAFQLAGEFFSMQMGISFSEVLDPQAQVSIPVMGTLKNLIGTLLFLAVDFQLDGVYVPAYLHLIRALSYSFIAVPTLVLSGHTSGGMLNYMDQSFGVMFLTALRIGIPMMGILFISSVMLGIMGRAAPQLNLMNMGIQVNITVGILVLIVVLPVIIPLMRDSFASMYDVIGEMFDTWPVAAGVR